MKKKKNKEKQIQPTVILLVTNNENKLEQYIIRNPKVFTTRVIEPTIDLDF